MISEPRQAMTQPRSQADDALSKIERLLTRARAGDISETVALARIGGIARNAEPGEIYQKPLG